MEGCYALVPSSKRPTDPDHQPFELRSGIGNTDHWRGMRAEGNGTSLLPGEIRLGVNIRPDTEGYNSRSGQSKLNSSTPATYQIDGIFEAGDIGGTY